MGTEADARTRLLEEAGNTFADKGFSASTVREICGRAGANLAAVKYYFGDKMGLYVESVKHAHAGSFFEVEPKWPPGMAPEQKLHDIVLAMMRHLLDPEQPPWRAKLMMRELAEPTAACKALVDQYIRPKAMALQQVIHELVPHEASLERIQMLCFSVVGQCLFYRVQEPVVKQLMGEDRFAALTPERVAEHIVGFTLAALHKERRP